MAEVILGSKTITSEEIQCPTGKVLSGAESRQGQHVETGELLWRGRMRPSNPDLYFCKLEANSASFYIALPNSFQTLERAVLCAQQPSLWERSVTGYEISQQSVDASPGTPEYLLQAQGVLEL